MLSLGALLLAEDPHGFFLSFAPERHQTMMPQTGGRMWIKNEGNGEHFDEGAVRHLSEDLQRLEDP
jgi:hypothetical protein